MSKEKIFTYFVWALAVSLLAFLFGSCWGIFTNDLSAAAATASAGMHTVGTVLLLLAVVTLVAEWLQFTPIKSTVGSVVAVAILLALSVLSYCDFFAGVY